MLDRFLSPVNLYDLLDADTLSQLQLGKIVKFSPEKRSDLSKFDLAILGVPDDRGSVINEGSADAPNEVRKQLYQLFKPDHPLNIIDLGNIVTGENLKDTYFAIASVMVEMLRNDVVVIIVGGGHDLTYGQYLGYQELYQLVNLVMVDERIDMNDIREEMASDSYLLPILMHQPNYLFNYSHLGHQAFYTDPMAVDTLESLNFDCQRLGLIHSDIEETEPVVRNADMVSIDMSAVRQSDAPANAKPSPNGLFGQELCQIARYAGMSDKVSSFGIYEINPQFDVLDQTSQLCAQAVWCFIEGYYNRKNDSPYENRNGSIKYTVEFEDIDHELVFWKSKKTNRWWMELPYGDKEKYGRHQLIPCSYNDYQKACKEELPDRWMKAYNKLV